MRKLSVLNLLRSNIFWAILFVASFTIMSCSKKDENNSSADILGAYNTKTIQHHGVERSYHVYLPNNFTEMNSTPIVLALHGGGGTGSGFENDVSAGTLTVAAEARGMILVMPEGIDKRWNDGRTEHFGSDPMYNDVGFISVIIDKMIQNYGVDANRVYVTGISNGGLMSIRLALELSNKITAIAPVTAQISEAVESIAPEFPISVMIINGTEDPLVPYDGGCIEVLLVSDECRGEVLSTQASIEKFRDYNQCTNSIINEPIINNLPFDGTSVEIVRYNDCEGGTEVVSVTVVGGGHTWPNGAQYLSPVLVGKVSNEINASELILDFFLNHSRN